MEVTSVLLNKIDDRRAMMTNDEIKLALAYYNRLEEALSPCPVTYKLMLDDVRRRIDRLNDWKAARQRDRQWQTEAILVGRQGTFVSVNV